MELVRERQTIETTNVEAQKHNAQISERYRLLQSAEADQFSQVSYAEPTAYAAPVVEETPVLEQMPQVTDFVHESPASPIFTAEKFENLMATPEVKEAVEAVVIPVLEEKAKEVTAVTEHYSLSNWAKVIIAAFAAVVIALLSLIAYNSQIIHQKRIQIDGLEAKREQLLQEQEALEARIAEAYSEESILEWAQSQGMVPLAA
jgi:cell division protein FtsL